MLCSVVFRIMNGPYAGLRPPCTRPVKKAAPPQPSPTPLPPMSPNGHGLSRAKTGGKRRCEAGPLCVKTELEVEVELDVEADVGA